MLRMRPVGELLPARRHAQDSRFENEQKFEEFHHHQRSFAAIYGPPIAAAISVTQLGRHTGLQRFDHGRCFEIRENVERVFPSGQILY